MTTAKPHGTLSGWNAHKRNKDTPCQLCKAANAGYQTAYRHRLKIGKTPPRCGTELGLIAHWARDENPCVLCQSWQRAYKQALILGVSG